MNTTGRVSKGPGMLIYRKGTDGGHLTSLNTAMADLGMALVQVSWFRGTLKIAILPINHITSVLTETDED